VADGLHHALPHVEEQLEAVAHLVLLRGHGGQDLEQIFQGAPRDVAGL
jgi:hypothetical protein